MNCRILIICILSFSTLIKPSYGRIGETERECYIRYNNQHHPKKGTPAPENLIDGAIHLSFASHGWIIRVALVDGRVAAQEYQKVGLSIFENQIKDDEISQILEAEKNDQSWERSVRIPNSLNDIGRVLVQFVPTFGEKYWKRTDGSMAWLKPGNTTFLLATKVAIERSKEKQKATEEAKKRNKPNF